MEKWVAPPSNIFEFLVNSPWPLSWAYALLAGVALLSIRVCRLNPRPPLWLASLPLVWFAWAVLSGMTSVDHGLSHLTLEHLGACVACFYLGLFALSRVDDLWAFFIGLLGGMVLVFAVGFDQHFGGLAESREYFYRQMHLYPQNVPPEFIKKINSTRIYSTLFYPNSLAGAVLLFLPILLVAGVQLRDRLQAYTRSKGPALAAIVGAAIACLYLYILNSKVGWILAILVGLAMVLPVPRSILPALLALAASACLFWSGSKGGWLLLLLLGLIALLRLPFGKQLKIALVTVILLGGLAGFFLKYAGFFRKGATSVVARFDYWHAAIQTTKSHPFLGTGQGTFAIPYEKIKRPESEMARMVHNDYLEQASDSGVPAMLAYSILIVGGLVWTYRRTILRADPGEAGLIFAIWLGVLGWSLQCFFEFSLYIPALAWPAFAFLGLLLGRSR